MTDSYISIDLETTGLNPRTDRIIEIGAIRVEGGLVTDTFSALVNPGRKLEPRIVELTGIRDRDLMGQPYIEEVLPELIRFLGEMPLLGHSILFDYSFLKKASVDGKMTFEKKAIDTLKIARKYLDKLERRSLDYLCSYFEIPHEAHRASEDARATHFLYRRLTELFYSEEDPLFEPQSLHYAVKRDTPSTKAQQERLYRLLEQHKIVFEGDVARLTRSEASRLTDRILAAAGGDTGRDLSGWPCNNR